MRKITGLLLVLTLFVFGGLYFSNGVLAAGDETIDVTVIKGDELVPNIKYQGTLGSNANIDIESLVTEGYEFAHYIHNGEIITDINSEFIVSKSNNIIVVIQETESPVIVYIDTNGKMLGFNQEPSNPPTKPGMTFSKYVNHKDTANVKVASYTITKTDDVLLNISGGQADVGTPKYNEVVELTPTIDNFSYWADKDGQIVSTNPNYKFTAILPNGETEIKLVAVSEEGFVAEPSVYLTNVTGIREGYHSFLGYINIVEGYEVVEYGLLASKEEKVLTLGAEGVLNSPSTSLNPMTNEFLKSVDLSNEFVSYRAYAVLSDEEGNLSIKYSDNNFFEKKAIENTYFQDFEAEEFKGTATSYSSSADSIIDNYGFTWSYIARNDNTGDAIDGHGLVLGRSSDNNYVKVVATGGIYSLSVDTIKVNSSASTRTLGLFINGEKIDEVSIITNTFTKETHTFDNLNITGEVTIELKNISSERAIKIDNLSWKSYSIESQTTRLYGITYVYEDEVIAFNSVEEGNKVGTFEAPKIIGKTFKGWFTNPQLTKEFDSNEIITKHLTLYAKYDSLPQYSVDFDLEYEDAPTIEQQLVYEGDKVTQPSDPEREGFVFLGWFLNDEEFDFETPITENIILVAKWQDASQMMNVTFMDGVVEYLVIPVVSGAKVEKPSDPEREGFVFLGWFLNDEEFDFETPITENIILNAKWEEVEVPSEPTLLRESDFGETNGWSVYSLLQNKDIENGENDSEPNGTTKWDILGGNVNGTGWDYIRMGGKDASTEASPEVYLQTKFTFASQVTRIVINIVALDSATGDETVYLQTSTNGTNWVTVASKTTLIGDLEFDELNIAQGSYFRFVFERAYTSKNNGTDVKTISFFGPQA